MRQTVAPHIGQTHLRELPKLLDVIPQKGQGRGRVGMKSGKEEEAREMLDGGNNVRVLIFLLMKVVDE